MKAKLRILLVEDNVADAELITHELEATDYAFSLTRVETETDFRHELEANHPDLVLADSNRPSFNSFRALAITRGADEHLPFIFISGSNDQGVVEHMYDEGATDYVFKRDIHDLKPAIEHALEETATPASSVSAEELFAGEATQTELKLSLPAPTAEDSSISRGIGRLSFCSRCRIAQDATGRFVRLEDYCANHDEVVIFQETCSVCAHLPW